MTDFLFATPTFISGFGAVIDWGGTMVRFNESPSPEEADYLALANDWVTVGKDIHSAMTQFALA